MNKQKRRPGPLMALGLSLALLLGLLPATATRVGAAPTPEAPQSAVSPEDAAQEPGSEATPPEAEAPEVPAAPEAPSQPAEEAPAEEPAPPAEPPAEADAPQAREAPGTQGPSRAARPPAPRKPPRLCLRRKTPCSPWPQRALLKLP